MSHLFNAHFELIGVRLDELISPNGLIGTNRLIGPNKWAQWTHWTNIHSGLKAMFDYSHPRESSGPISFDTSSKHLLLIRIVCFEGWYGLIRV